MKKFCPKCGIIEAPFEAKLCPYCSSLLLNCVKAV